MNWILTTGYALATMLQPAFTVVIKRPLEKLSLLFFHSVLVNFYRTYLSIKKIVLSGSNTISTHSDLGTIISNRQTIHVSIVIIALITLFTSVSKTHAENYIENTLLISLVQTDFRDEELVVETAEQQIMEGNNTSKVPIKYVQNGYVKAEKNSLVFLSEEEILNEQTVGALAQGGSAIIKPSVATTDIERRQRTKSEVYVVQQGETVTSIAQQFDVSVNTILWENNLSAYSIIRPGQKLTILPATGLTHTVKKNDSIKQLAKTYQVEPEAIMEANKLLEPTSIKIGQVLFIPEGLKPKPKPKIHYYQPPSRGFVAAPKGGNYIWPTNSYRITQYFTWRHFGLDIANRLGQPIYAAADGKVVISSQGRWNGGYGNQVVIDHGNGVKTRYGHASYNLVSVGQKVTQGQPIAVIGSTGRSTGPHVHFEIMINGRRVNPLNYLRR